MTSNFDKWWRDVGYKAWSDALDAEGGALKALEMVFAEGAKSELQSSTASPAGYEVCSNQLKTTTAIEDIVAERKRQIEKEGWTLGHDDEHQDDSLVRAAVCYALPDSELKYERRKDTKEDERTVGITRIVERFVPSLWPSTWACWCWKPKDRRRDLVRATALLLAEIERIDRKNAS
ncbi:MAG: hypothetical protein AB2792_23035 [Candidatus Thiodiazotropha sp.]